MGGVVRRHSASARQKPYWRLGLTLREYRRMRNYFRQMAGLPTIWELERLLLDEARRRFASKAEAAKALGLTREGYRKKLARMGLG